MCYFIIKKVPNSALTVSFLHNVPAPAPDNDQYEGIYSYTTLCPHAKHILITAATPDAAKIPI